MLRSFQYAAAAALERSNGSDGPEAGARTRLVNDWETAVRTSFLAAYAETVRGGRLIENWDAARGLLKLFEIEKAIYEVRYELANRPGWVGIPLRGLARFLPASTGTQD